MKKLRKKLVWLRRSSQTFFFLLFLYILWSTTYPLKGLFSPEILFKIDPLVILFTAVSERVLLPGIALSLGMLLATAVLGRFFCGWVCPLGTFSDAAGILRIPKRVPTHAANRKMRRPKYFLLGMVAVLAVFGIQAAWIFDPMVMIARFVSLNLIPTVTLVTDWFFQTSIQNFDLYEGPVVDLYRDLRMSFLGVKPYFFSNSFMIFLFFLVIVLGGLLVSRLWCRMLCPLGALYSLPAKTALLERAVGPCADCGICQSCCRMGAIKSRDDYAKGECILCMDCVYECPQGAVVFTWRSKKTEKNTESGNPRAGISRKDFLALLFSGLALTGFRLKPKKFSGAGSGPGVLRPPGALPEENFVNRCIRCGNCMKVCPTNGLQPVMLEAGPEGIWTPRLVPEIGYCEYNCTLCGYVCPTGAIPKLSLPTKQKTKLGIAVIDRKLCLAWNDGKECIVCEEHCPIPEKAIKLEKAGPDGLRIFKPRVDQNLCIGCGICQKVCPVEPVRAVRVFKSLSG